MPKNSLKTLGKSRATYRGLEVFDCPKNLSTVLLFSNEVTAVCPVTGQPDWYTVSVLYEPSTLCIESKTFKLFLQSLRSVGEFCEALATRVLNVVVKAARPTSATVTIKQKPRGGVAITATAVYP